MKRIYTDYLHDIMEAIEKAEEFVGSMCLEEFVADEKTHYAVLRALTIIGEATKRIPRTLRSHYPDVPWSQMAGMRDKVTHDYFGVNLSRVYQTIRQDLPPLKAAVSRILTDLEGEEKQ